jgi:hypothetical protein
MRILYIFIFAFLVTSYDGLLFKAKEGTPLRLEVHSDYGSHSRIVSEESTGDIIVKTMESLDWGGFHQVVLTNENGNWLEVGGSLDPSDGLSVMYQENGTQRVIGVPPVTVKEMTEFLLLYLEGKNEWKSKSTWN